MEPYNDFELIGSKNILSMPPSNLSGDFRKSPAGEGVRCVGVLVHPVGWG